MENRLKPREKITAEENKIELNRPLIARIKGISNAMVEFHNLA